MTFPMNLNDKDEALRGEVYWEEFKHMPMEYFEMSVNEAISSCAFFPKPAELHEFVDAEKDRKSLGTKTREAIDWMKPTEEGKKIAIQMIGELHDTLKKQDEKAEKERAEKFEKNRAVLKKQAKLLIKNKEPN